MASRGNSQHRANSPRDPALVAVHARCTCSLYKHVFSLRPLARLMPRPLLSDVTSYAGYSAGSELKSLKKGALCLRAAQAKTIPYETGWFPYARFRHTRTRTSHPYPSTHLFPRGLFIRWGVSSPKPFRTPPCQKQLRRAELNRVGVVWKLSAGSTPGCCEALSSLLRSDWTHPHCHGLAVLAWPRETKRNRWGKRWMQAPLN